MVESTDATGVCDEVMQPERIGLFGGTFDPLHQLHLAIAAAAEAQCELGELRFVVANDPWMKASVTPASVRLAMVREGVAGRWPVDDSEIIRGGVTYTIDTVRQLQAKHPQAQFVLVLGADAAESLSRWRHADQLRDECELCIFPRGGFAPPEVPAGWRGQVLEFPTLWLSSTQVRDRTSRNLSIEYLVPEGVRVIVESEKLYRSAVKPDTIDP